MRYLYTILCAIIVLSSCNVKKAQVNGDNGVDTLQHALLWKISKENMQEPSYLFGTIHLIAAEDFYWPKGTLAAFDASEQVVFEIDMNKMQDMSSIMKVLDKMYMPGDTTLKMLLNEEKYDEIKSYFQSKGLPIFFFDRIKPLFLSAMVGMDMSKGSLSERDDIKSYEMELQELASSSMNSSGQAMDVVGLETIELQMSFIDKIPLDVQARMLYTAIQAELSGKNQLDRITQLYLNQNINAMVESIVESQEMGKYSSILLDQRNRSWIPIIDSLIQKKSSFIAVGAGHLAGKEGVINLLREQGYTLTPLSVESTE